MREATLKLLRERMPGFSLALVQDMKIIHAGQQPPQQGAMTMSEATKRLEMRRFLEYQDNFGQPGVERNPAFDAAEDADYIRADLYDTLRAELDTTRAQAEQAEAALLAWAASLDWQPACAVTFPNNSKYAYVHVDSLFQIAVDRQAADAVIAIRARHDVAATAAEKEPA